VDRVVAVSDTLVAKMAALGREAKLLTHGVDVPFWSAPQGKAPPALEGLERPLVVFWGVVDRRMDLALLRRLVADLQTGTVVLAGPEAEPHPELAALPRVLRLGSLPFDALPPLAREAGAPIMPHPDLPA